MTRPIRVAHASDIHWYAKAPVTRLVGKRAFATLNVALGRRRYASAVQTALVDHLRDVDADVVVITGDLTTSAHPDEFRVAREALDPLLSSGRPVLLQPGNHDVYTGGSARDGRFRATFGPWMHDDGGPIARLDVGDVTVLGLDPCRPAWLSSGRLPDVQLDALVPALDAVADRAVLLALHYPLLDRHGAVYDGFNHGLVNASDVIAALGRARRPPAAILHGHVHHGFTTTLNLPTGDVPVYDVGTGGQEFDARRQRAAATSVYTVDGGAVTRVERWLHDGERFAPEPGGAYATGR
jgi:3',5'-cyclic AMP phosphodiesterase CpdA